MKFQIIKLKKGRNNIMATLNLQKKKMMSESNYKRLVNILVGLMASQSTIESQCLTDYIDDGSRVYQRGNITIYNGYIYEAKTVASGTFDETKWTKIGTDSFEELDLDTIKSYLNLSQQDLDNLQNLIDDAQITLTKTHSSSKIYMDIQQCLEDSKTYTLKEINKLSGASYKVVTSTSEMTSESIIYLLPNATNYDMYIVEVDGTATKIGNMDVDLSQYFTKTEIETDYLKKTDADGKYATITTVDGKVDKANILSIIQDTDNSKVFGAKAVFDTFNQKADKVNLYEIKEGEKSKHIVIDLPASHSISGKTTRLFVSDNNSSIGLQIWKGSTLEKDFRTPLINPLHIFIPSTPLTPVSTKVNFTNSDSSCFYSVINGICYVNIWSMNITSNLSVETLFNGLPRAKVSANFILSNSVGSKTVGMGWISGGTQVIACNAVLEAGTAKSQGYTRFSYPVDETWIPS